MPQMLRRCSFSTHTAGLYGAGAGARLAVVGVADWTCLSSGAMLQGLTPGVLGEMGVVGSTYKQHSKMTHFTYKLTTQQIMWSEGR